MPELPARLCLAAADSGADREHYSKGYNPDHLTDNKAWFEQLARIRMRIVEEHLRTPGRVLDVGCGYGFFLKEAATHGWDVSGIEPAEHPFEYASHQLSLNLIQSDVQEGLASLPHGSFDLITFWHVLEHLERPGDALKTANELLKPGGVLIANSPNLDSFVFRCIGKYWSWIYTPGHLQYFSLHPFVPMAGVTRSDSTHERNLGLTCPTSTFKSKKLSCCFQLPLCVLQE